MGGHGRDPTQDHGTVWNSIQKRTQPLPPLKDPNRPEPVRNNRRRGQAKVEKERLALAAQLYSSPDFADKRFTQYMDGKVIESMVNPEGVSAISLKDIREAGKESFGRTRQDASKII